MLARKASGRVDGFVVEGPTAGGHNAPPRGEAPAATSAASRSTATRDVVDLDKMRELGLPFWLAGGAGRPSASSEALAAGAAGIQVGTLFAYCDESGLAELKRVGARGTPRAAKSTSFTDPRASPTGYPFKVVSWPGESGRGRPQRERDLRPRLPARRRIARRMAGSAIAAPAEPVEDYVRKGGAVEDTVGSPLPLQRADRQRRPAQVRADGERRAAAHHQRRRPRVDRGFLRGGPAIGAATCSTT